MNSPRAFLVSVLVAQAEGHLVGHDVVEQDTAHRRVRPGYRRAATGTLPSKPKKPAPVATQRTRSSPKLVTESRSPRAQQANPVVGVEPRIEQEVLRHLCSPFGGLTAKPQHDRCPRNLSNCSTEVRDKIFPFDGLDLQPDSPYPCRLIAGVGADFFGVGRATQRQHARQGPSCRSPLPARWNRSKAIDSVVDIAHFAPSIAHSQCHHPWRVHRQGVPPSHRLVPHGCHGRTNKLSLLRRETVDPRQWQDAHLRCRKFVHDDDWRPGPVPASGR